MRVALSCLWSFRALRLWQQSVSVTSVQHLVQQPSPSGAHYCRILHCAEHKNSGNCVQSVPASTSTHAQLDSNNNSRGNSKNLYDLVQEEQITRNILASWQVQRSMHSEVKKVLEVAKRKKRNERVVRLVDAAARGDVSEVTSSCLVVPLCVNICAAYLHCGWCYPFVNFFC